MRWDIGISCYEPLEMVTGGIGTYTRMLLQLLGEVGEASKLSVAFFCKSAPSDAVLKLIPGIRVFVVPPRDDLFGRRVERIGSEHDWYSVQLSQYLLSLSNAGHSFRFFEFSDYGVEGYFSLKLRRAGLLKIDRVGVRLHSPELMLFRDNGTSAKNYGGDRFTRMSRELFCYEHCDYVLYGAKEMLLRVDQECSRFGLSILDKAVQVEHPYPMSSGHQVAYTPPSSIINIGYVGRLETRKGILKFVSYLAGNKRLSTIINRLNINFHLFGADLHDDSGLSVGQQIQGINENSALQGKIKIRGYMSAEELRKASAKMQAFVFPSLFENYPNALLEVLHLEVPALVSESGGMLHISSGLPGIHSFSYDSLEMEDRVAKFLESIKQYPERPALYYKKALQTKESIVKNYLSLAQRDPAAALRTSYAALAVDFVIPFYNDSKHIATCLEAIGKIQGPRDHVFVVNDGSLEEEAAKLRELARRQNFVKNLKVYDMPANAGPSAARNAGVALGSGDLIQFIDSDDFLDTNGYRVTYDYICNNRGVDFVYGLQASFGGKDHIWFPRDSSFMTCLDENYTHSAILIKRSVFEKSRGYDTHLRNHFEDWQFYCKLAMLGFVGEVVPVITQHYLVRENSRTFQNHELEYKSRAQVIDRTSLDRLPVSTRLEGEMMELIGKYASMINTAHHVVLPSLPAKSPALPNEVSEVKNTSSIILPRQVSVSLEKIYDLSNEDFLWAAYAIFLARSPDPSGFDHYMHKLNNGVSRNRILSDISSSKEVKTKNASMARMKRKLLAQKFIGNKWL